MRKSGNNIHKIFYRKKNYISKKKVKLFRLQKFGSSIRFKKKFFKKKFDNSLTNKSKIYSKIKKVDFFTKRGNINLNIKKNVYTRGNSSLMEGFFNYLPPRQKMIFFPTCRNTGGIRGKVSFYRKLKFDFYKY